MTKSIKNLLLTLLLTFALVFTCAGATLLYDVKADATIITLNDSASCKIDETLENSGLRFTANVEKEAFETLFETYDTVEAGIIIVPADYVLSAGGYTLDKLSVFSELSGKTYYQITPNYRLNGDYYEFDTALKTIQDFNYNRNFTGVAFIKITDADAQTIDGFTEYDGAFYQYSNSHDANVYTVAYNAHEDRVTTPTEGYTVDLGSGVYGKLDSEEYDIIKNYIDGVAVIADDDGELSVSNNGGVYYKSPYKVIGNDKGDFVIDGQGVSATCFTLNSVRKSVKAFALGDNYVSFAQSKNATYNQDGSVTTAAGILASGDAPTTNGYGANENGYVGLEGNFGVGTYIETMFTASNEYMSGVLTDFGHDNIPQIILFADSIDGIETVGKGLLLSTGVDTYAGTYEYSDNYVGRYSIHGLDRMPDRNSVQYSNYKTKDYPLLTQRGLKQDLNNTLDDGVEDTVKTYKYVVGTFYNQDGQLVVRVSLFVKNGNAWDELTTDSGKSYTDIYFTTEWTATDVASMGTNIILMAEHKGKVWAPTTTFTYSAPYTNTEIPANYFDSYVEYVESNPKTKGNVVSENNGSIEMLAKITSDDSNKYTGKGASCWSEYWYYYAYQGNYGAGWYLDFTFTGINMPQLTFFANNGTATTGYASYSTNGNGQSKTYSTDYGRKGVVVLNGVADNGDYIHIFGPNRMMANGKYSVSNVGSDGSLVKIHADDENGAYKMMTRNDQYTNHASDTFKYTIGTFIGTDGKVWIDMYLKNITDGTESHLQKSLGITESEVGVGDIIITPPLAGGFGLASETSISFNIDRTPYYRKSVPHVMSSGATVGTDGSLTMANKDAQNDSKGAGQWAQYNNYYSFAGDYGVGYYLDFKFTGYNMPQFIFFADNPESDTYGYASPSNYATGSYNSTIVDRQGVVVLNGFGQEDNAFQVWGPNRWYGSGQKYGVQGSTTKLFLTYDQYPELTRKGQVENATKEYDLTIGTHIGSDGKVWMEIILSSNGTEIYHVDQSLNLTEAEVGVGDIIILPPFGNYKDAQGNSLINGSDKNAPYTSCTIKYFSNPYLKAEQADF